jgi:hypothetical protein
MKYLIPILLFAVSCISYESVLDRTMVGSYEDPEFGLFDATLKFNSDEIEPEQDAHDMARLAAISMHELRNIGEDYNIPEYGLVEDMLPYVKDSEVRVASEESFEYYCPVGSIACNMAVEPWGKNVIILKDGPAYSCANRNTIGHEYLHSLLRGIGHPENISHNAPHVFVWRNDEVERHWHDDSAEEYIRINPASECGYEN